MPEPNNISFDSLISYPLAKMLCPYLRFNFLTANMLTMFRFIPAILFYYMYIKNYYWISLGLFVFTIFTGCLDGAYARMYNQTSEHGKMLNHITSQTIMIEWWLVFLYKKWSIYYFFIMLTILVNKIFKIIKRKHYQFIRKYSRFCNDNLILIVLLLYPYLY